VQNRGTVKKALPFGVPFFRFFPHERKESAPGGTDKPTNPARPTLGGSPPRQGKYDSENYFPCSSPAEFPAAPAQNPPLSLPFSLFLAASENYFRHYAVFCAPF
jgi:hypothetical protein